MPAVIDKALDFINGMNTSASSPEPMDESTAKGILKYLKELGVRRVLQILLPEESGRDGTPGLRKNWLSGLRSLKPVNGF